MKTYTPEQQKENRKKWIEALRSGEYTQTKNALRQGSEGIHFYCCLGVACDISGLGYWDENKYYIHPGCSDSTHLPIPVQDWLGLRTSAGRFDYHDHEQSLMNKNDTGYNFEEIAQIIEDEPTSLVVDSEGHKE